MKLHSSKFEKPVSECACGIPSCAARLTEILPVELLNWMVGRCPVEAGMCDLRRAIAGRILTDW